MPYCTATEVKEAVNYPSTGAPVSDAVIEGFILDSQEEIENLYKTHFGNVEDSGTADGDYATTTFSDSTKAWTNDAYVGYVVWIYGGTGSGQYREISANDATKITVSPVFSTPPDATSTYRITKLGYISETVDGSGTDTQFTRKQPLISLNELTIDSTSVTPSYVYTYNSASKLLLGTADVEAKFFTKTTPQLIDMKYVFGVYPMPRIIKRLCIDIAGIRTLISQIAGTYDDFTAVTLPGSVTGSKGEPYVNIQSSLNFLQGEARGKVYGTQSTGQVSADFRTGSSYRPFVVFG